MSKAVLISIRPKWCEKIASGEKTIEVRKTRPKLDTPFKCYIYCTLQGCNEFFRVDLGGDVAKWNRGKWWDRKGKVIGEFVCRGFIPFCKARPCFVMEAPEEIERMACLTRKEIWKYAPEGNPIGWRISDLLIYDAPRELSEFWRSCPEYSELSTNCLVCENVCGDSDETDCNTDGRIYLRRAPQSWCYVEEVRDE